MISRPGWVRLWAIAVLAHIIGNPRFGQLTPPTALGVSTAILAVTAAMLLARPTRPRLTTVNVLVLVLAWFEAPVIGNHWLLAAVVAAVMLVADRRDEAWTWFAPTARLILLAFYTWAAFNKLNGGFFDPSTSCAVVYANQWLAAIGMPGLPAQASGASVVAVATAAVELSVPLLLLARRTRTIGVVVASAFHLFLSFDLGQHFYDFTAVLLPLFVLFLPDDGIRTLDKAFARDRIRLFVPVVGGIALIGLFPQTRIVDVVVSQAVFVPWAVFTVWYLWWLAGRGAASVPVDLRPPSPLAWVVVALVVFNGLTPYLEVKTATSWNMYSNLVTAGGHSNHLVLRRTLPLTDVQEHLVTVVGSDDPGLSTYVGSGYALPERNLAQYLVERPDVAVTYQQDGHVAFAHGSDVARPLDPVRARLQYFRAVDLETPARCKLSWLPAG